MSARSELMVRLHGYAFGSTFEDVRADLLAAIDVLEKGDNLIACANYVDDAGNAIEGADRGRELARLVRSAFK